MNKKYLLVIGFSMLIALSIILDSCCTKKQCVSAFDQKEIKLIGFTKQESDLILVSSYVRGSDFTNLVDSASIAARTYSGTDSGDLIIFVPIDFNAKADYSIVFKKTGLTYKISEISTSQKICNSCFLTEDNFTELSSYKLNDLLKINSPFEIVK